MEGEVIPVDLKSRVPGNDQTDRQTDGRADLQSNRKSKQTVQLRDCKEREPGCEARLCE